MLSRRGFGRLIAAALAARVIVPGRLMGQMRSGVEKTGVEKTGAEQTGAEKTGPQFSVMMWALNKRGSFEENLERVAQAGYRHVELVGEFARWSEADWLRILARMRALKITVDATSGMKLGFADPSGGDGFVAELKGLIPMVQRLGCGQIILLSGKRIEGAAPGAQRAASIETLKRAAKILGAAGLTGLIEPIDRLENPSIDLDGVTEAFEIVRAVGSPRMKVLYDLYHEQRGLGNLIEKLEKNIDEVGLIHVADVPGRHEPGTGEVNYGNVYRTLARLEYRGVIAMEFYPTGDVVETLRRAREEALRAWGS
jgi:hydroxypyruvate isomerase